MSKSNNKLVDAEKNLNIVLNTVPYRNHFKLQTCNDFVIPNNWEFTNRINDCFHVAFIRDGQGAYYLENQKEEMIKGKIVFVSSGYCHSRKFDMKNIPRVVLFRFWLHDNTTSNIIRSIFTPFAFTFIPEDVPKYNQLFTKVVMTEKKGLSCCKEKMCSALLFEIMCELLNDITIINKNGVKHDPRIIRASEYVKNNITKNIKIDQLANVAQMSRNYFRDLFKEQYGVTPKKYIIKEKIKSACMILSESNYTVKQVSDYLGYSDPYAFSKQFKLVMGCSPSQLTKNKH